MKCSTCLTNEAEHNNSLCVACDREEWKDSTTQASALCHIHLATVKELRERNNELLKAIESHLNPLFDRQVAHNMMVDAITGANR